MLKQNTVMLGGSKMHGLGPSFLHRWLFVSPAVMAAWFAPFLHSTSGKVFAFWWSIADPLHSHTQVATSSLLVLGAHLPGFSGQWMCALASIKRSEAAQMELSASFWEAVRDLILQQYLGKLIHNTELFLCILKKGNPIYRILTLYYYTWRLADANARSVCGSVQIAMSLLSCENGVCASSVIRSSLCPINCVKNCLSFSDCHTHQGDNLTVHQSMHLSLL